MTNFDFLQKEQQFKIFSSIAITAEKSFNLDYATCIINCRRAMEFAIKWLYSIDSNLQKPIDDNLLSLMKSQDFKNLIDKDLMSRLHFIRKAGNIFAHDANRAKKEGAILCLENLYVFMNFIAYCYAENYEEKQFDKKLLDNIQEEKALIKIETELNLEKLIKENEKLKEQLTKISEEKKNTYVPKALDISEYETRKLYIDVSLKDIGWVQGKNWIDEVEVYGMPNKSGKGFIDYVLYDDDNKPLAIIEAKRTCIGVEKGRQQAKLYADILENKFGTRPIIFLTNGFETKIIDGQYPERKVSNIYSKRDLQKLFNLRNFKKPLNNVKVNKNIAGRYYQEGAIKAICKDFDEKNKRHALLVMATGSGKTRTVIELCNILINNGFIKNVLFLADRTSLITQAKRSFVNLLPNLSVSNILEKNASYKASVIFSTYQTMINCIDEAEDEQGKIFTTGHFDLIICDEAHRSIYNKYKDIFTYFDSLLVGLTATPKDEIDKNTYEIFNLEKGQPTYGYELAQAVKDGYLVDFMTIETKLKFLTEGIKYDELSNEEKEEYEKTFVDEDGHLPKKISNSALNKWIYNENTIKEVLNILMTNGIFVDYGSKIGKTIIFAKNHRHAEKIFEVFNKEYSHLKDYAKVIDNYSNYSQSLIDEFSDENKMPQIAISVDMLDTGIDVPEIVNLVFFKKVMSRAKFWQMIGRGTRLCPKLLDGKDKNKFYIFDFCNNFEFFRMSKGNDSVINKSLQSTIFNLKIQMIYKLQDVVNENDELKDFRNELINDVVNKIKELNKNNFAVKQHLKYIELYSDIEKYNALTYEDTEIIEKEVSPLVQPYKDDITAVRFDALLYKIQLAKIIDESNKREKKDLLKRVKEISEISNITEIDDKRALIDKILKTEYIETANIKDFENIRLEIRNLIKYIEKKSVIYDTNFIDKVISTKWKESELEDESLYNYKEKAEIYIRENQNNEAIKKLKTNLPLTKSDLQQLENILWNEVGSKNDYNREIGEKPLGEFVREIVGLDMKIAKETFNKYLGNNNLNSEQIYFVNQIIEYIVQNGVMKDFSILQEAPFTDKGSVVDLFDDLTVWSGIKMIINDINNNVLV